MTDANSPPITLRLLAPGDAPVFRAVMVRCWTGTVAANSSAYREIDADIASDLSRGAGVLMFAGGSAVGCGRFVPVAGPGGEPDWVEIKRVGVDHAYRGQSLGALIAGALETEAIRRGYPGAQLGVRSDQPRLAAFWEGLGYAFADDVTLSNPNPLTPTPVFMRKRFIGG